jgi:DNA polymerase III subunit epsilon
MTKLAPKAPTWPSIAPPPWWNAKLSELPLAFVDLEMTGLNLEHDRIVEICIERVVGGEVIGRLHTLVNPGASTGEQRGAGDKVHGIAKADLDAAPTFASQCARVLELLEGAVFVAHAAKWDLAFLQAETARLGAPLAPCCYLDTLNIARKTLEAERYSLQALATELAIPVTQAHRASDDVRVLRSIFEHCVEKLKPASATALWIMRTQKPAASEAVLATLEAALNPARPVWIRYRRNKKPIAEGIFMPVALDGTTLTAFDQESRARVEIQVARIVAAEQR